MKSIIVLLFILIPIQVNAIIVEIDSEAWSVSTVSGTFEDHRELLMAQEWWEDISLAITFADLVDGGLGWSEGGNPVGPAFSYKEFDNGVLLSVIDLKGNPQGQLGQTQSWVLNPSISDFAVAERVSLPQPVPVPGSLQLMTLGMVFLGFFLRKGRYFRNKSNLEK